MSVRKYRSDISGLEEAIQSFKQASCAREREEGRARLKRAGQALIASPSGRATPADIQRAERALDRSSTILIGMAG